MKVPAELMADLNDPCIACRIVQEEHRPPGGVVWRSGGFVLHALAEASPLPGWMVLTSERHARAWGDLSLSELAELGPVAARVMNAQKEALGAEHVYAFAIGDALRHFHLHLVPRYADTPQRLRGRGAFEARPGDLLPEERVLAAVDELRRALGES